VNLVDDDNTIRAEQMKAAYRLKRLIGKGYKDIVHGLVKPKIDFDELVQVIDELMIDDPSASGDSKNHATQNQDGAGSASSLVKAHARYQFIAAHSNSSVTCEDVTTMMMTLTRIVAGLYSSKPSTLGSSPCLGVWSFQC
jgi:hypothetical protein